jgi:integrase
MPPRILACDVLAIPWALSFDWQSLSDQARALEPEHRTLAREAILVRAVIPAPKNPDPLPATADEIARITDALRRSVRLVGHAYATEETYVHWTTRFIRFCLIKLKQTPKQAVPGGVTAYLDYLALERNVAPATQSQALNALSFLTKNILGLREFTLDHYTPARGQRRPPVVMTRAEVRSLIARLEDPWKLVAQLMDGSGLRVMETLRLRVKDLDFGQASSHQWDYARASHHHVSLCLSTRQY